MPTETKSVTINSDEIVVSRQALLDLVCAIDIGARTERVPLAMDALREPFFADEVATGQARKDFSLNKYDLPGQEL